MRLSSSIVTMRTRKKNSLNEISYLHKVEQLIVWFSDTLPVCIGEREPAGTDLHKVK